MANDSMFYPPTEGEYLYVVESGDCSYTSDCFSFTTTSIANHLEQKVLQVFPNPSKNLFKVELVAGGYQNIEFQVHDVSGKVLQAPIHQEAKDSYSIDLEAFASGIYFLHLSNDGYFIETVRLVKQ